MRIESRRVTGTEPGGSPSRSTATTLTDQDFKEGAVRLVRETGRPIAQIAKDLGINPGTLANWVALDRQAKDGNGRLSEDERIELARLRRENAELAMERDVLNGLPRVFRIAIIRVVMPLAADFGTRCRPLVEFGRPAPSGDA
ncbi:transposase [Pseudonocardia sp. Cha107L01]|uniref:transposase n=1 Tax=Pseudonocardia sp. Cha107L01 TaxID=3457576 RepID=UPI00403ECD37